MGLKTLQKICMVGKKKVSLVRKKYDMVPNTGLIKKLRNFAFQQHITLNSLG